MKYVFIANYHRFYHYCQPMKIVIPYRLPTYGHRFCRPTAENQRGPSQDPSRNPGYQRKTGSPV